MLKHAVKCHRGRTCSAIPCCRKMNVLHLPPETVAILALGVAALSLTMSCVALWPQLKNGFAILRDGVLWIALIAVVSGAGSMIWRGYRQSVELRSQELMEQPELQTQVQTPIRSTLYESGY